MMPIIEYHPLLARLRARSLKIAQHEVTHASVGSAVVMTGAATLTHVLGGDFTAMSDSIQVGLRLGAHMGLVVGHRIRHPETTHAPLMHPHEAVSHLASGVVTALNLDSAASHLTDHMVETASRLTEHRYLIPRLIRGTFAPLGQAFRKRIGPR